MLRSILTYLPLLFAAIVAFMFQGDYLTAIILVFAVFAPLLLMIHLRVTTKNAVVHLKDDVQTILRGETLEIPLLVKDLMWLSPKLMSVEILLTGGTPLVTTKHRTVANLSFNEENMIVLKLRSEHCGLVKIQVDRVRIYDYLGLFYRSIRCDNEFAATFMPHTFTVSGNVSKLAQTDMDSEIFSLHKSGDDPSQVYEIREYRDGDSQKRIHWKLSAKTEQMMVKEYSLPLRSKTLLLLHPVLLGKDTEATLVYLDTLLDCISTISTMLLTAGIPQAICFLKENQLIERPIETHHELKNTMKELAELDDTICTDGNENDLFIESVESPFVNVILFTAEENPSRIALKHRNILMIHAARFSKLGNMHRKYVDNIVDIKPGKVPEGLSQIRI